LIGKKDKNDNTSEDEADESQAGMQNMDEDLVQKSAEQEQEIDVKVHEKLVKVSDMVMELIYMGQGEVDEWDPMILQSIKNMSTTLAVLTGLQQCLMAANSLLSITKQEDGTYDIGKVLLELQNFMVKITGGADGVGLMLVNYGGGQIHGGGGFNVIQRIYGYLENVLAGMAMMTEPELSMSALRYEQRDGQSLFFKSLLFAATKRCASGLPRKKNKVVNKGQKERGSRVRPRYSRHHPKHRETRKCQPDQWQPDQVKKRQARVSRVCQVHDLQRRVCKILLHGDIIKK
jgi:hypothetical protein